MTTSYGRPRRLVGSPFQPDPEPIIECFEVDDLVSHDSYGMGRVVSSDAFGVTVDFGNQRVRVTSPFRKMSKL